MKKIKLYCDGGCRGNGKEKVIGAWAYVVLDENNNVLEKNSNVDEECSTNIRAEMYALSEGLKAIAMMSEIEEIENIEIEVFTDSKFICDCFNLKWIDFWLSNNWIKKDKKPVANKDLWELLLALESLFNNNIKYNFCKGHNGIEFNEMCDNLVNIAMDRYLYNINK